MIMRISETKRLNVYGFRRDDEQTVKNHDQSLADIMACIQDIQTSIQPLIIKGPMLAEHGVIVWTWPELEALAGRYEDKHICRPGKVTPASGAASRMFGFLSHVLQGLENGESIKNMSDIHEALYEFLQGLEGTPPRFAFTDELKAQVEGQGLIWESVLKKSRKLDSGALKQLIEALLNEHGLGYKSLPKALIPFHARPGGSVTALEEQIREAHEYGDDRLHLTVSLDHLEAMVAKAEQIKSENRAYRSVKISFSDQHASTDSVALDENQQLVRDGQGQIKFYPAGHGSLIKNLQKAGLCILRNVDNVQADSEHRRLTRIYHRAMTVYLQDVKDLIQQIYKDLDKRSTKEAHLDDWLRLLTMEYHVFVYLDRAAWLAAKGQQKIKRQLFKNCLNRPLRVVGLVENQGAAGGGPFFVEVDGILMPAIVEKDELRSDEQRAMMKSGQYFNPVDIILDPTDPLGRPFKDLTIFGNQERIIQVTKMDKELGQKVHRRELPGLWNGRMDKMNAIFVELPKETFTPVKQVNDLLDSEHQIALAPVCEPN